MHLTAILDFWNGTLYHLMNNNIGHKERAFYSVWVLK